MQRNYHLRMAGISLLSSAVRVIMPFLTVLTLEYSHIIQE